MKKTIRYETVSATSTNRWKYADRMTDDLKTVFNYRESPTSMNIVTSVTVPVEYENDDAADAWMPYFIEDSRAWLERMRGS